MMMRLVSFAVFFAIAAQTAHAQGQSFPGLIAARETATLSYEDRLAAFDAEQAALAQGGLVTGFDWKGPKGAYGTIIVGGIVPQPGTFSHCRRFIHIVHHKNDGGRNPTFQGTVCRDGDGKWKAK